jgi:hypothetical protein
MYGFWYNLALSALGASAGLGGCPENSMVGTFQNNTGHSNGLHGLYIINKMVPRQYECNDIIYDFDAESNGKDPFW